MGCFHSIEGKRNPPPSESSSRRRNAPSSASSLTRQPHVPGPVPAPVHEDPLTLVSQTSFTLNEVEALFELYKSISSSLIDDGLINRQKLQLALFQNPDKDNIFANRIFDVFDVKHIGVIEFGDFVRSISVFHPNAPLQDKIEFSFQLFDLDGSGFIERSEVKQMLVAVFSESGMELVDESIDIILYRTFLEADLNQDGKIDKLEWESFVTKNPSMIETMTLPHLMDVTVLFPGFIFHSIG